MVPTFIIILLLLLLFSRKFRESLKSFLKHFTEFFDLLIVKYKDSFFKLTAVLIITLYSIDLLLGYLFRTIVTSLDIVWNFLSDFIDAAIWLYFLKRTASILFQQKVSDFFKTDFGIIKSFILTILSIVLVISISYVTEPIALQLPTLDFFDEVRKEWLQKPENAFEFILLVFSISIIPAFIEEIFFRGILYKNFRRKYGITASIIFLTIIFYLFHLDPQMIFFLIAVNAVLCLSFEYTKSLVVPFVIHLGMNFIALMFYLNIQNAI